MATISSTYRSFFTKERTRALYVGLFIFALSLVFQYYAGLYSAYRGTQFVGDAILDNIPAINLNPIVVEGALWAIFGSVILIALKPRYIIFSLKAVAVFLALRAFFVAVTHLGIYPTQISPSNSFFDQLYVSLGLDFGYFFSAHTGLPFFMALIFWDEKRWRYIYLTLSAIFGVSVLFAHVHYSIDVFAAPFMAYSIFKASAYLFRDDYLLTKS